MYIPQFDRVFYKVRTSATSGSISTQYFDDKFNASKVEIDLEYVVSIYPPASVKNNSKVTLRLHVERVSLADLSSGEDTLKVVNTVIPVDRRGRKLNKTVSKSPLTNEEYKIQGTRDEVLPADVRKQNLKLMPGFRLSWYYSGMKVEPEAQYFNSSATKVFIRKGSINNS